MKHQRGPLREGVRIPEVGHFKPTCHLGQRAPAKQEVGYRLTSTAEGTAERCTESPLAVY